MVTTGVVLNERYRLDEPIATGGMGRVWRATDLALHRTVAVKTLLPALVDDPDFGRRFQAEAKIMASVHHPGLVDVYDYGCAGEDLYLVMPYVDGEPLSRRLDEGRLGVDETLSILSQAARALHAAHHHGIVHRDVKPGNLLVASDGRVRLVDFGIARAAAATATTANRVVGTALYMAPEQALGRTVTSATDVYALGAVGYHCLTGAPPFPGDNPIQVALSHVQDDVPPLPEDIPEPVRTVVLTALAKDPADRFASAADLAEAVDAARSGRAVGPVDGAVVRPGATAVMATAPWSGGTAAEVTGAGPDGATMVRRRWVAAAGALIAAIVVLVAWFGLVDGDPAAPAERPGRMGPAPSTSTRNGTGGAVDRPTQSETTPGVTPTPAPGPGVTSTPEPTAEPTPTPETTTEPVEPPPPLTSEPAVPDGTPGPDGEAP